MNRAAWFLVFVFSGLVFPGVKRTDRPEGSHHSPNDPFWNHQRKQFSEMRVPEAWTLSGTYDVKVAVIDYGFNLESSDLRFLNRGKRIGGIGDTPAYPHPLADHDHGTGVAGLLGAQRSNSLGMAGVGGPLSIYPLSLTEGTDEEVAEAIRAAMDQHVDIINLSIGSYTWKKSVLEPVIRQAYEQGILLCAAAGNDRLTHQLILPASLPQVMAIGGSEGSEHFAPANYGDTLVTTVPTGISVVAPAFKCVTLTYDGTETTLTGTSAACAQVTGVAALIKSAFPSFNPDELREIIETSADKIGGPENAYRVVPGFTNGSRYAPMGYGRVNALAAMRKAARFRRRDK